MIKDQSIGYRFSQSKAAKSDYIITLEVTSQFKDECLEMLEYIKKVAGWEHSFSVVVDPGSEDEKKFYVDGDGWSHINKIEVEKVK